MDSIGNVYVADNNNNTIRKVTSAGVVSTLAGLSGNFGSTDGSGNTARFHSPTGVAIDTAGNLFVADAANNTIRTTRQVGKADQLITFGLLPDKSAGDPPFAVTATATSGLPVTLSIISGPATVSSNIVTLTGAGVVTVRASQSGNATFNAALNVDRSFTVATLPQFVTFGTLSQQVVGDAPFSLAATSTSGQAVTYSIISGPAEMTGNIVTITGSGLIVVRASVAGDSSHLPASVDQAFVASPGINLVTDMQVFGNSSFYFRYYGLIGKNYVLQQSSDLVTWEASPFQVNGLGYYEITQPIQGERLFFRVTTP